MLRSPGEIRLSRISLPPLASNAARVRFLYCGICGTDVSHFKGLRNTRLPYSLGHEFVGEVEAVGSSLVNVAIGDPVVSDLNYRCGMCHQCMANRSHLCVQGRRGAFSNRAFAKRANVNISYLYTIKGAADWRFAITEPLSCTLHSLEWASPQRCDTVLIIGCGGLGMCMAFALWSSRKHLKFDIYDRNVQRIRRLHDVVKPQGTAIPYPIPSSYNVVFDLSGTPSGLRLACESVIEGGRVCSMSHLDGYDDVSFLLGSLTRRDITFTVSYLNGDPGNLLTAIQLITEEWSEAWCDLCEILPCTELEAAFRNREHSSYNKTIIDLSIVR